jgi:DNA invertase Pin-like site-specific DNA recombinase
MCKHKRGKAMTTTSTTKTTKLVAYYRVSTKKQGKSGLGLEGQQAAVEAHAKAMSATVLKAYTEVETGKRADRPQLQAAIAHAKLTKATLVIAKLDRLSRNVAFLSALMESGVEFVACDNPCADKFTIHVLACVAEKELRDISSRTKSALSAYKARGGLLGSARPELRSNLNEASQAKGRAIGNATNSKSAQDAYASLVPMMQEMRTTGSTLQSIAVKLNEEGYTTRRGNPWSPKQVELVLARNSEAAI